MHSIQGVPSYYFAILLVIVVMALRMRRMSRERPLRLELIWVVPALLLFGAGAALVNAPPKGLEWIGIGLGVVIGGGFGWMRGKSMHIAVDPVTHAVTSKGSQAAMVFIVILVAVRFGLRSYLAANASTLHVSIAAASDAFIAFALGMVWVQRIEMGLRAARLLKQARAAGSSAVLESGTD